MSSPLAARLKSEERLTRAWVGESVVMRRYYDDMASNSSAICLRMEGVAQQRAARSGLSDRGLRLRVDDQVDFLRKKIGNFADQVSAKNIDQGVAARGTENEARRAESGGDIDNGFRSGRTHGITKKRWMIACFLFCDRKDF